MDFVDSSKLNRNFYVPAFAIKVGKNDLLDKRVEVFGVTVNNTLEGADDFSFTVNNPFNASRTEFKYLENKFFDVGKEVKIKVGYGDRSKLPTILHGIITSLDVSFPSNGISQLTVKGFDFSHKMMKGKDSKTWGSDNRPIKYSDIVKEIVTRPEYGFKVSNVENTLEEHPQVKQKNESDYDFIKKKLANEISYEVFVIGKDFYFRPRANTKSEVVTTLQWGRTLISFTPEINTADQVNEVEVRGWNPARQKAIVGKASQGQEQGRDGGRKTGSDVMASIQKQVINHVWQPVFSKKEADDIAKSILEKTALEFVKGNGECIGLPGIMPGKNIELRGLGETFSKIYYIEKATHTVSTSGYKTTFSVKENSI